MAMIPILDYPDKRLKSAAEKVEDVLSTETQSAIRDMFETLYETPNCVGLAATQLDFQTPKAITVIDVSDSRDEPFCLINPEIIEATGETFEPEGCMSVYPGQIKAPVKRFEKVVVKFLNQEGEEETLEADGFLAKCIQHEIDHLQGRLYVDYIEGVKWKMLERKITKVANKKGRRK